MQIKRRRAFFYKGKRGGIDWSFEELIGGLLAVIIIGLIIYVSLRLSGILIPKKDYESTLKSFEILNKRINELIKDRNYANSNFLYFLDDDFVLIGFNYKDSSIQMEACKTGIFKSTESFAKSRRAIGSLCEGACLCIYKNSVGKDFDKDLQLPIKCEPFEKNVVFLTPFNQNFCSVESGWHPNAHTDYYQADTRYKFLIRYGTDFNTKEIYLDKYESTDGNVFIFLAEYKEDPNDIVYKRKKFMEEQYEKLNK